MQRASADQVERDGWQRGFILGAGTAVTRAVDAGPAHAVCTHRLWLSGPLHLPLLPPH